MAIQLVCEVNPGKGRILVATEPLIGVDTQHSEQQAVQVVTDRLGVDLSDKDVIFIFEANQTHSVDGGSAGAAMALCLLSELTGRTLNSGVSITGTIQPAGMIGPVSGILPKARTIAEDISVFLIPKGQAVISTHSKKYYSPRPGVYIEEIYPIRINITEYAAENLGLQVVEVGNLSGAESWFFSEEVFPKETQTIQLPNFPDNLLRMNEVAEYELSRAEKIVDENNTAAWELLEKARNAPSGSPYTKANYAFLAYIMSTEYEDVELVAGELKKQFSKIETSDPHWRGEAELRLSWAFLGKDPANARKEWLMLSAKMLSLENFTDKVVDVDWVKGLANEKILQAKEELERAKNSGSDVTEAEGNLIFAVMSFDEDLYFSALYGALDTIAWSRAAETSSTQVYKLLQNSTAFSEEFSESYRRHAFYLAEEGDMTGAAFSLFRAELREDIFKKGLFALPTLKWPSLDLKWLAIILLAWAAFSGKKEKRQSNLNHKELMFLTESKAAAVRELQTKLKDGEITEKTYYKILKELD